MRDPDLIVVNHSVVDRNPVRVDPSDVVLVIEIVSPGSRRTDRVMKAFEYAKAGIGHYWIVGDQAQTKEPLLLDFALGELTKP